MNDGWAKVHRSLINSDFWLSESFTRGQSWVDLILLANHCPGFIYVRGNKIDLDRGDVGWSKLSLSKRWKWSRGKVGSFIKSLQSEGMISIKQDNRISTVLSILNYDKYQSIGQQTIQQTGQQNGNRPDTNKNEKNEKNEKKGNVTSILLTKNQLESLTSQFPKANVKLELRKANDYIKAEGVIKNDYLAWFRNWLRKTSNEVTTKPTPIIYRPEVKNPISRERLEQIKKEAYAKIGRTL